MFHGWLFILKNTPIGPFNQKSNDHLIGKTTAGRHIRGQMVGIKYGDTLISGHENPFERYLFFRMNDLD
jgi:hypothetical protein